MQAKYDLVSDENQVLSKRVSRDNADKNLLLSKLNSVEKSFLNYREESGQRELLLASKLEKIGLVLQAKEKQQTSLIETNSNEMATLKIELENITMERDEKDRKIKELEGKLSNFENNTNGISISFSTSIFF